MGGKQNKTSVCEWIIAAHVCGKKITMIRMRCMRLDGTLVRITPSDVHGAAVGRLYLWIWRDRGHWRHRPRRKNALAICIEPAGNEAAVSVDHIRASHLWSPAGCPSPSSSISTAKGAATLSTMPICRFCTHCAMTLCCMVHASVATSADVVLARFIRRVLQYVPEYYRCRPWQVNMW